MEQLPPQQKMVYYLRRIHGLKISEIAAQLNISPLTVKKHISQASRSLRLLLEKQIELTGLMVIALVKALIHLF
jgi:DNA-directed RNA polymerase specialized sigma24 family protein